MSEKRSRGTRDAIGTEKRPSDPGILTTTKSWLEAVKRAMYSRSSCIVEKKGKGSSGRIAMMWD